MFIAIESFVWRDSDGSFSVIAGVDRVHRDHPMLRDPNARRMFAPVEPVGSREPHSRESWRIWEETRMATKFKADEIVIAIEPFVTSCLPSGPFPVAAGQRLRADHSVVKATPDFWVADGTPSDEVGRLRTRIYQRAEADMPVLEAPTARIERRIPDAEALVAADNAPIGILRGTRVHRSSEIAKANKDRGEPSCPCCPPESTARTPCSRSSGSSTSTRTENASSTTRERSCLAITPRRIGTDDVRDAGARAREMK